MSASSSTMEIMDAKSIRGTRTNDSTVEDSSRVYKVFSGWGDTTDSSKPQAIGILADFVASFGESGSAFSYEFRSYEILKLNLGNSLQVKSMDSDWNMLKERFESLSAAWRRNTAFFSSVKDIALDSNYQQIIGMGEPVVPLILSDLGKNPSHWYWALTAITGENPAKDSPKGDIQAICDAWIDWGRSRGLLR